MPAGENRVSASDFSEDASAADCASERAGHVALADDELAAAVQRHRAAAGKTRDSLRIGAGVEAAVDDQSCVAA